MGPLPAPPPNPTPSGISWGGINSPGPGVMGGTPQKAGNLVGGILGAIQGFWAGKKAKEEHYSDQADTMIQQKMLGLPVNDEKLLKAMQRSGKYKNLQFDPPSPPEAAAQQQVQQQAAQPDPLAQAMSAASGPGAGPPGMPAAAGMQPPPPPPMAAPPMAGGASPAPPPQGANPSLMARMQRGLGLGGLPQPSMQSPAGQWASQLSQASAISGGLIGQLQKGGTLENLSFEAAKRNFDINKLSDVQKVGVIQLMNKALMGDPKSIDSLQQVNILHELPGDSVRKFYQAANPQMPKDQVNQNVGQLMMYLTTGGPGMKMQMMKMAQELTPRFGGDLQAAQKYVGELMTQGTSSSRPGFTPEENQKNIEGVSKIMDQYPYAPYGAVNVVGMSGVVPGLQPLANKILTNSDSILGPRNGTIAGTQFKANNELAWATLNQRTNNELQHLTLDTWTATQKELGEEAKPFTEIISNPKQYGTQQYNEAIKALGGLMTKKATIPVDYKGAQLNLPPIIYDPYSGTLGRGQGEAFGITGPPQNILGMQPAGPGATAPFAGNMKKPSADPLMEMIQNLQKYPADARQQIYKNMNPGNDPEITQKMNSIEQILQKQQKGSDMGGWLPGVGAQGGPGGIGGGAGPGIQNLLGLGGGQPPPSRQTPPPNNDDDGSEQDQEQ